MTTAPRPHAPDAEHRLHSQVKFRDPVRERARAAREAQEAADERAGIVKGRKGRVVMQNRSWSKKLERMERREKRRKRKELGPEQLKVAARARAEAEAEEEESEGEQEQLRKEMLMLKKLKQRKVTLAQYDAAFPVSE